MNEATRGTWRGAPHTVDLVLTAGSGEAVLKQLGDRQREWKQED